MSTALYVLSTLGGYLLTSALLLKCPGLLHRPKRHRFRCRHISHRGDEEKPCSPLEGRSPNLGTCTQHGVRIETDFIDTDGRSGTDTPIRLGIDHGPGKVSD
ncbi:UNVERIFIED_CONTAM: hypothetical protein K2H54_033740 [Gekko kuhli]